MRRVRAVGRTLPDLTLRLDAEQGYTARQAIDVAQARAVARVLPDGVE